jgi:predicted nuclease of predicted toxin-antitoxin system
VGGRQLPPVLVRWLIREYAVDAEHVNDIGFLGEDDEVIFAAARSAGSSGGDHQG